MKLEKILLGGITITGNNGSVIEYPSLKYLKDFIKNNTLTIDSIKITQKVLKELELDILKNMSKE